MPNFRIPSNLELDQFGDVRGDREKVAYILECVYRGCAENRNYNIAEYDLEARVPLHYETLRKVIGKKPERILNRITRSPKNPTPDATILETDGSFVVGQRSRQYRLTSQHQVVPQYCPIPKPVADRYYRKEKKAIAKAVEKLPKNLKPGYRAVCDHIKKLRLEITEDQLQEILAIVRQEYVEYEANLKQKWVEAEIGKIKPGLSEHGLDEAKANVLKKWDESTPKSRHMKMLAKKRRNNDLKCAFIESKVRRVRDGDKYVEFPVSSIDQQGRLHHHLANMSKCLRPFVRLEGGQVVSYDLSSSHCVFFCMAVEKYIEENNYTVEMARKQAKEIMRVIGRCTGKVPQFVLDGFTALKDRRTDKIIREELKEYKKRLATDFYQHAMDDPVVDWERDAKGERNRDTFKSSAFFRFLYGKNLNFHDNKLMMYFLKHFPVVYTVLWRIKDLTNVCKTYYQHKKKHTVKESLDHVERTCRTYVEFPKQMQKEEAVIFFEEIIPEIMKRTRRPFVSIHDSIVFKDGNENNKECPTMKIIKDSFKRRGIKVKVKRENWNAKTYGIITMNNDGRRKKAKDK